MKRPPLALLLAPGWKSVPPRSISNGAKIVWQQEADLYTSSTDFEQPIHLGQVGAVDCPIAIEGKAMKAYRYVCSVGQTRVRNDKSEIRAFDLNTGESELLFSLGLNKWLLWLFQYVPARNLLLSLVATDMPGEGVNIQHQLGLFDLTHKRSLLVHLPRDAFCPLALCLQREELLFYGVEGYQRINFKGKRLMHLPIGKLPVGRGASYHPTLPVIALGGQGIALWNYESNSIEQVHDRGQCPVWERSGNALWFSETSGDLFYYDCRSKEKQRILSVAGSPLPELKYARPVQQSRDGRYLTVLLTRKVKRKGADTSKGESLYYFVHALCILDLEMMEVWQQSVPSLNWALTC